MTAGQVMVNRFDLDGSTAPGGHLPVSGTVQFPAAIDPGFTKPPLALLYTAAALADAAAHCHIGHFIVDQCFHDANCGERS